MSFLICTNMGTIIKLILLAYTLLHISQVFFFFILWFRQIRYFFCFSSKVYLQNITNKRKFLMNILQVKSFSLEWNWRCTFSLYRIEDLCTKCVFELSWTLWRFSNCGYWKILYCLSYEGKISPLTQSQWGDNQGLIFPKKFQSRWESH